MNITTHAREYYARVSVCVCVCVCVGSYFAGIMLMCSLSVVCTVLVLNYHHRSPDTHHMPRWVTPLLAPLLLCFKLNKIFQRVAQLSLTNLCDALHHGKRQNFKTVT